MSDKQAVYVEWYDAYEWPGGPWVDESEVTEQDVGPLLIREIGFVLLDTQEVLVITAGYHEGKVQRPSVIPRSMIRFISKLRDE